MYILQSFFEVFNLKLKANMYTLGVLLLEFTFLSFFYSKETFEFWQFLLEAVETAWGQKWLIRHKFPLLRTTRSLISSPIIQNLGLWHEESEMSQSESDDPVLTFKLFFPQKSLQICKSDYRWRATSIQ